MLCQSFSHAAQQLLSGLPQSALATQTAYGDTHNVTVHHYLTARDALALCCRKDLGTIMGTDAMLLALTCSNVTQ